MKIILFIMLGFTFIDAEFLRDDTKEIVRDTKTNLMWQDDTTPADMNWSSAIVYCKDLTLAGFTNWRLPKVDELNSIVDKIAFKNKTSSYYWSSTTFAGSGIFAWHIYFSNGYININIKKDKDDVRCVR
jgi:hypothetical protein